MGGWVRPRCIVVLDTALFTFLESGVDAMVKDGGSALRFSLFSKRLDS